MDGIMTDKNY